MCEHSQVSRTTLIVLIALGATFAGFVLASNVRDLRVEAPPSDGASQPGPQSARLGWRETYGSTRQNVVFTVDRMQVPHGGWKARIGIANHTSIA